MLRKYQQAPQISWIFCPTGLNSQEKKSLDYNRFRTDEDRGDGGKQLCSCDP